MALHIISKQHLEQLLTAFTPLKLAMKRAMKLAIRKIRKTSPGNFRGIVRNRSAQPPKPKLRRLLHQTSPQAARRSSGSPDPVVHISFAQYQSSSQTQTGGQGSGRYRRLANRANEEPAAPRPIESKTTAEYKKWLQEQTRNLGRG